MPRGSSPGGTPLEGASKAAPVRVGILNAKEEAQPVAS